MITLTAPGPPLSHDYVTVPGGFCWWYADVVDAAGNGVVVIAGFGLPFLPGLAGAARDGAPVPPAARPSVNVAVYEAGRCTWYGLLEVPPATATWSSVPGPEGVVEEQRFDACRFVRSVRGDVAEFVAELDVVLPHGRLRGTVALRGRARGPTEHAALSVGATEPPVRSPPTHDWSPQVLRATGRVELVLGDAAAGWVERRVVLVGSGYHDRNGAREPLHALGIDRWCWARSSLPHEDRVLYALWPDGGGPPRAFGVVVDDRGSRVVPDLRIHLRRAPTNWLGLRRIDDIAAMMPGRDGVSDGEPFLHVRAVHVVDDGPFYSRALCASSSTAAPPGAAVDGVVETVAPHRIDVAWQRPFVRMRVTPAMPSSSSLWHPLFVGDAHGRVGRLLRTLRVRAAAP
jgi:hypothetical protein